MGSVGTGACDLDIHTLRVELSAVLLAATVEVDDLMAEDIVTGSDGGRNSGRPSEVVLHELLSSPLAVIASLVDLNPAERRLIGGCTITAARSDISKHRTDVVRPVRPEKVYGAPTGDLGGQGARIGVHMTVDVQSIHRIGFDVTPVQTLCRPGNELRGGVAILLAVDEVRLERGVSDTVSDDLAQYAVSRRMRSQRKGSDNLHKMHDERGGGVGNVAVEM